jgi:hypothetical protein
MCGGKRRPKNPIPLRSDVVWSLPRKCTSRCNTDAVLRHRKATGDKRHGSLTIQITGSQPVSTRRRSTVSNPWAAHFHPQGWPIRPKRLKTEYCSTRSAVGSVSLFSGTRRIGRRIAGYFRTPIFTGSFFSTIFPSTSWEKSRQPKPFQTWPLPFECSRVFDANHSRVSGRHVSVDVRGQIGNRLLGPRHPRT